MMLTMYATTLKNTSHLNSMTNKFRIIIPSYNNSNWVDYNISSVLNQTYKNYEVYYIDDSSTDSTLNKVLAMVGDNPKFKVISNKRNKGAMCNYVETSLDALDDDNTILCHLDGDDWLHDITVLEKLNEFYNRFDVWMTYGGMIVYNDDGYVEANPQNSPYPDDVHKYKLYRGDIWRASHFRTYRAYLWKSISTDEFYELGTESYYNHASDLAFQFACLEICPPEKIGVVPFKTYVYNATQLNTVRTHERQMDSRHWDVECEIRNRRPYREGLGNGKYFHMNVVGYPPLKNPNRSLVSTKHNQTTGDFDVNVITDFELEKFIQNQITLPNGKVIADLHESRRYSDKMSGVYEMVYQHHTSFDRILTYDDKMLTLPNASLRLCMSTHFIDEVDGNINIHSKTKNISCISSNKSFLDGHTDRLAMIHYILSRGTKDCFDMFGDGFNFIEHKIDGLRDYRFSIAIENGYLNNMATEKISDCFLTGTIPIYYGCPNIGDYFHTDGIITFNTAEELEDIIHHLHQDGEYEYRRRIESVIENFHIAKKYSYSTSDDYFEKHVKKLIVNS
jgi:glycosyltransferase involved in cell wall biosynthesis